MDQDLIRIHLIKILSLGMKLSAIAERTRINAIDLSRFKNGQIYLKKDNAERLNNYLEKVNIPEKNTLMAFSQTKIPQIIEQLIMTII